MRKEVLLAITIGFVLGLIITFGIYTANKSLKNLPQTVSQPTSTPAPVTPSSTPLPNQSPTPTNQLQLSITSPQDESLVTKNTLAVSGHTTGSAAVAVLSETGETLTVANSAGDFSATVTLEGGYNRITVTATSADGKSASQTLTVTYTTAQI